MRFYPYSNFDFIYAREGQITETGAEGLNLSIDGRNSFTLRSELGFTVQAPIKNKVANVAPFASIGWVNMVPLAGNELTTRFLDTQTTFSVEGWNKAWNLLSLDIGIETNYKSFSFNLEYSAEVSPGTRLSFLDQAGVLTFDWKW